MEKGNVKEQDKLALDQHKHFHPSANPAASMEDIKVTKRIKEAGELLGINLIDHVIIGE